MRIAEKLGDPQFTSAILNCVGLVYFDSGQQQTACEYYERALRLQEEDGDSVGIARSLNNLGMIHDAKGMPNKALELFEHAVLLQQEANDRDGLASTLNNLGHTYESMGRLDTGREYYERSLQLLWELEEALDYYTRALRIQKKVGDHNEIATFLNNMGTAHRELGRPIRKKGISPINWEVRTGSRPGTQHFGGATSRGHREATQGTQHAVC